MWSPLIGDRRTPAGIKPATRGVYTSQSVRSRLAGMAKQPANPDEEARPICSLCGATVEEIRRGLHWHGLNGFGQIYTGRCVRCDVDFRCEVGTHPHDWRLDAPDAGDLVSRATDEELDAISHKLSRYPVHGKKWERFLARRRREDELWHYRTDADHQGIAVVRIETPVASFGMGTAVE